MEFVFLFLQVPFSLSLRLWDIYMLEGERLLVAMSYNMLRMHQSKISYTNIIFETFLILSFADSDANSSAVSEIELIYQFYKLLLSQSSTIASTPRLDMQAIVLDKLH